MQAEAPDYAEKSALNYESSREEWDACPNVFADYPDAETLNAAAEKAEQEAGEEIEKLLLAREEQRKADRERAAAEKARKAEEAANAAKSENDAPVAATEETPAPAPAEQQVSADSNPVVSEEAPAGSFGATAEMMDLIAPQGGEKKSRTRRGGRRRSSGSKKEA